MRRGWRIPPFIRSPWTLRVSLRRQPKGTELIEYDCIEGERSEIHFPGAAQSETLGAVLFWRFSSLLRRPRLAQNAGTDLRGIWMAENNADASLERAQVIVDPPDGKIPYRPDALPNRSRICESRYGRSGEKMLSTRRAARRLSAIAFSDFPERPRRVYRLSGRSLLPHHLLGWNPHNEGLGYAMGDSRGHWEGNTLVADVTSFSDATWLDASGNYHSDQLHVVERYTRASPTRSCMRPPSRIRRCSPSRGKFGCRFACRRGFRSWRMNVKRGRMAGGIT